MFVAFMLIAPDAIQQRQTRKNFTGMAGKVIEQIEFARREVYQFTVQPDLPGQRVDIQAVAGDTSGIHQEILSHRFLTAENRLHPGNQLQQRKRFRQIIIGPHFQPLHALGFARTGANNNHR